MSHWVHYPLSVSGFVRSTSPHFVRGEDGR